MTLRSFGGGGLKGDNLVRFVYLDESGIGNPKVEPIVVVAGVIVHADKQWKALEQYLKDMIEDVIRPEDKEGFYFHAKDLFHGTKNTHRNFYPQNLRLAILEELCSLPEKFDLPIVMGFYKKTNSPFAHDMNQVNITSQAIAAVACSVAVERYMRTGAEEDEVAALVYEDNNNSRKLIRNVHNMLQNPKYIESVKLNDWNEMFLTYLPFERIIDTAHFAGKRDTSILQIADACAFILQRKLTKKSGIENFFQSIRKQLIIFPKSWEDSSASVN